MTEKTLFPQLSLEFTAPAITPCDVEQFCGATQSTFRQSIPPTFATRFREGEFALLRRLGRRLASVLHTEQVYEYYEPLPYGGPIDVRVRLESARERTMGGQKVLFLCFDSEMGAKGRLCVRARTHFLVREQPQVEPLCKET